MTVTGTRRLVIAALVLAMLAAGASAVVVWRTYEDDETPRVKFETDVRTTNSPAADIVTVPRQVGRDAMVAVSELAKLGLEAKISHKPSTTIGRERVIGQRPVGGTRVSTGTVIEVFLSSGPP